jgi:hypothetical protein
MRERIEALEDPNPVDQLACLVLRVLAELSPCTEILLLERVWGSAPQSEAASNSHTRQLVHSALLKLEAFAFIKFAQERIAITDEGRGCLEALPVVITRQSDRSPEVRDTTADRQVAAADREQEGIKSSTKAKLIKLCASSLSQLQARLWARHDALMRLLATTVQAGPQLKSFCQVLAYVCVGMLCVWKHVTPMVRSGVTTLVHVPMQSVKDFRRTWQATRLSEGREAKRRAWLSNVAGFHDLLPDIKLAGVGLSASINYAGAFLLVSGALAIAGGISFLSGERADGSNAEVTLLVGNRAGSSRTSPIVWRYEGQDRLGRSIFVTRRFAGGVWIEGVAIAGENSSNQTLTSIQGAIKMDSGEEIELSIDTEGSQVT